MPIRLWSLVVIQDPTVVWVQDRRTARPRVAILPTAMAAPPSLYPRLATGSKGSSLARLLHCAARGGPDFPLFQAFQVGDKLVELLLTDGVGAKARHIAALFHPLRVAYPLGKILRIVVQHSTGYQLARAEVRQVRANLHARHVGHAVDHVT